MHDTDANRDWRDERNAALRDDDPDLFAEEMDDGDYDGVERDENMDRIEGPEFWNEPFDIDTWGE